MDKLNLITSFELSAIKGFLRSGATIEQICFVLWLHPIFMKMILNDIEKEFNKK